MFKTIVSLLMAIVMFTAPLLTMAQQAEKEAIKSEARAAAEKDAKADTNSTLWFVAGCLGGATGLIIAYIYKPSPPAARLVGKSEEYVAFYTDFYKEKAKSIQTSKAWTGCLTAGAVYVGCIVVQVVAASAASTSSY